MNSKDLIYSGKAKNIYKSDNSNEVIIEFRDDMTAGDGERKETMKKKGYYNSIISAKIFKVLEEKGIPTQFIELIESNIMKSKKLEMIPIEFIVRNIATGSLVRKFPIEDGKKLNPPIVQTDYKNDEYHDPMLNDSITKALGIATQEELDDLYDLSLKINNILSEYFKDTGIILVDYKIEFGKDANGNLVLGDEISPDSCRLWDSSTLEMLDKELFRKGKDEKVMNAYEEVFNRIITEEDKKNWNL
ncbi:MAG: phosphoribosylaminoimidazolesuccinocarboxamide synthase [Methanobacteriaceae archaeon]|jgi:phosphoribosylaminoimidazole-succinocarboxamide synthase|nr:phosphoribosylaminoimidazolesuccinocarboxamide synthase [Methanobacteriaceae archaeon]